MNEYMDEYMNEYIDGYMNEYRNEYRAPGVRCQVARKRYRLVPFTCKDIRMNTSMDTSLNTSMITSMDTTMMSTSTNVLTNHCGVMIQPKASTKQETKAIIQSVHHR